MLGAVNHFAHAQHWGSGYHRKTSHQMWVVDKYNWHDAYYRARCFHLNGKDEFGYPLAVTRWLRS